MDSFQFQQHIRQLEPRMGAYFYLQVDADIVDQLEKKKGTRLICTIDREVSYQCGLNHLGDGNFYIIIAKKYLKQLGKELGDPVTFEIHPDPNPLGVDIPEVLQVLLDQDEDLRTGFEQLTDGKKRGLIYVIQRVKNIDLQVQKILKYIEEHRKDR